MKASGDIWGGGRSGKEQGNKGTRKWENEDEYGNEEAALAGETGKDNEETGRQRDNEEKRKRRKKTNDDDDEDKRLEVKVKGGYNVVSLSLQL